MFRLARANFAVSRQIQQIRVLQAKCMSNGSNGDGWKDVLEYWFSPGAEKRWFGGGETVDNEIRSKFGTMVDAALQGGLEDWELEPKPSLALIILTDQFTRSIFRGSPRSYDGDVRARKISRKFLERKTHDHLKQSFVERSFIYIPMEHSESAADQELSVALAGQLAKDAEGSEFAGQTKYFLEYAKLHKEVIDKFGRYPQRNKVLGRKNTQTEDEFLQNLTDKYKW